MTTCAPIIAGQFVGRVMPLIVRAKNTIDICVFDWRWYPSEPAGAAQQFNRAIVDAARRGVRVRAIVNSQSMAEILKKEGVNVKKFCSAHLLHTKLMMIDEKIIITGSHNYTQSAFSANYELSVVIQEMENIQEYQLFFARLWSV